MCNFADLDKSTHEEISRRGGQSAHAQRKAHTFSPAEAAAAGKVSGEKRRERARRRREGKEPTNGE